MLQGQSSSGQDNTIDDIRIDDDNDDHDDDDGQRPLSVLCTRPGRDRKAVLVSAASERGVGAGVRVGGWHDAVPHGIMPAEGCRSDGFVSGSLSRPEPSHRRAPGIISVDGTSTMALGPLVDVQVSRHPIPRHPRTPNTPVQRRPLMIYRGVSASSATASTIEAHLLETGVVLPQWRHARCTRRRSSTARRTRCSASRLDGPSSASAEIRTQAGSSPWRGETTHRRAGRRGASAVAGSRRQLRDGRGLPRPKSVGRATARTATTTRLTISPVSDGSPGILSTATEGPRWIESIIAMAWLFTATSTCVPVPNIIIQYIYDTVHRSRRRCLK